MIVASFQLWKSILLAIVLSLTHLSAMTAEQSETFVRMALAGIDREYPYKPGHVWRDATDIVAPREKHPVFYGHFDWHSSVHGHWMLVRLLRLHPDANWAKEVRAVIDARFTQAALAKEAA